MAAASVAYLVLDNEQHARTEAQAHKEKAMRDDSGAKYLSAARVIELLQQVPADAHITPNMVGNLCVYHNAEYLGYISFLQDGEVCL
jgi:hypothetical protein